MLRPWRRLYRRFSGATSARSWKCRGHRGAALQTMRASMGPRARARGNPGSQISPAQAAQLQWGHERALVEIWFRFLRGGAPEWLQWGHERALVEIQTTRARDTRAMCFNGATSARSWK